MNTLLALLAVGLADPPAAPAPAVALHTPTPVAAKGDIKAGPPLAHTFELTHKGPAGVVNITGVTAGCGCLRRALSAGVLQPGETARLTVEVNTLTQPDGPNRWQAVVAYTVTPPGGAAGKPVELPLALTATLSRDVSISRPQVAFSTTGEATQTVTLTDRRPASLTVVRADSSSPHLTATVGPREGGPTKPTTTDIVLKLSADAPSGHRDEAVVLLTDDPAYPELRIPVRVLKRQPGGVTAAPAEVAVRFGAGQDSVSALVQLRAADGKPVGVSGAESDHPGVTVKWSAGSGPVAAVRVTVAGGGPGAATVRVKLAEPAGQEVVIPVTWTGGK